VEDQEEKIAVVQKIISPVSETPATEVAIAQTTPKEDHGVTLVFTAEEVNEKYLDKKALAEATSNEKKTSMLRKLYDKAYDLKHNQNPFGDLRQKKNEILALNFKSEKQRSQNK
jgi:CRISPR/Cas system CSM-associated protein Csm2 small subunit